MSEQQFAERRISLEERKSALEGELARARLAFEQRQAGRFSGSAVTLIGTAIAVVSSVATTTIGGWFDMKGGQSNNEAQFALKEKEVLSQLEIKRTEVEGQIRVQDLVAKAERARLEIEQRFEIVVQATKGLPPDIASENLSFFVEAGILEDPEGRIRRLAAAGRAPDLPNLVAQSKPLNPLLERLAAIQTTQKQITDSPDRFIIEEGVVRARNTIPVTHLETAAHGGVLTRPRYVILHFTAAVGPAVVSRLTSEQTTGSSHLLVQRDGSVIQLLPLDYMANHVGRSAWGSLSSLNNASIGIDFENWGQLERSGEGWKTFNGEPLSEEHVFLDGEESGWHAYTDAQIETAIELMKTITAYDLEIIDILGHSDVSSPAGQKIDPGPALPIADLREAVFGRRDPLPPPN